MTVQNEKKPMELTETQLIQMARQEEAALANKKALVERVGAVLSETAMAKDTLNELKKAKEKMLVNIGSTILIEVGVTNTKMCKRGFAQNGYKDESVEDTITWLAAREEQIRKQYETLQREASQSNTRLTDIVGILRQIEGEKRKNANSTPPRISR